MLMVRHNLEIGKQYSDHLMVWSHQKFNSKHDWCNDTNQKWFQCLTMPWPPRKMSFPSNLAPMTTFQVKAKRTTRTMSNSADNLIPLFSLRLWSLLSSFERIEPGILCLPDPPSRTLTVPKASSNETRPLTRTLTRFRARSIFFQLSASSPRYRSPRN